VDLQGLFAAASDPLIWEQHPVHDRSQKAVQKIGSIVSGRKDVAYRGAILEHLIYQIKKSSHNVR
jgi:hypothetical protein